MKQNNSHQHPSGRRLSDKRHLLGNERHLFTGVLKAHAVVFAKLAFCPNGKRKALCNKNEGFFSFVKTETNTSAGMTAKTTTIFDVCADDHCQRYQGITKASNATVAEAVRATRGQLLMYGQAFAMPVSPNVAEE